MATATLTACGGGSGGGGGGGNEAPPQSVTPAVPAVPTLSLSYGINTFKLSWNAIAPPAGGGAVTYRVTEDPDGAGPTAAVQIASDLSATNYDRMVKWLLPTRLNATYQVQACNSAGCSALSAAQAVNVTEAPGNISGSKLKASNAEVRDRFGPIALSGDGNTLAVGAPGEDSNGIFGNQANNSNSDSGAVYIFTRSGNAWVQQTYLKASNVASEARFGVSVALSSDGSTLAVGSSGEKSSATGINGNQADTSTVGAGAVYVFTRSGSTWAQQAYVKASNTGLTDYFGTIVALSSDGNTLAVGANGENSSATGINGNQADNSADDAGAVYVFTRSGIAWTQQAYIKASNTGPSDHFGGAVALSSDGNTLAVGASGEAGNSTGINGQQTDDSAGGAGAVYVYTRSGNTWTQHAYVKASNTQSFDYFGNSVALSGDGTTLAVGAYYEASNVTGINGNQADNSTGASGAVYVFTRGAGNWTQQAYVKASNPKLRDYFGGNIALSSDGNTLAVGASGETRLPPPWGPPTDDPAAGSGSFYIFSRSGTAWTQQANVKSSTPSLNDHFGGAVALSSDGSALAVSAPGWVDTFEYSASSDGAVYVY